MGAIIVADTVRPEAVRAVQALEQMRLKIVLLTGDTRRVAQRVARDLRISEFESHLLPEDIVLLGNDLARFAETVSLARRTRGIIWQNFVGTIAVDTLGIILAGLGFLNPLNAQDGPNTRAY